MKIPHWRHQFQEVERFYTPKNDRWQRFTGLDAIEMTQMAMFGFTTVLDLCACGKRKITILIGDATKKETR